MGDEKTQVYILLSRKLITVINRRLMSKWLRLPSVLQQQFDTRLTLQPNLFVQCDNVFIFPLRAVPLLLQCAHTHSNSLLHWLRTDYIDAQHPHADEYHQRRRSPSSRSHRKYWFISSQTEMNRGFCITYWHRIRIVMCLYIHIVHNSVNVLQFIRFVRRNRLCLRVCCSAVLCKIERMSCWNWLRCCERVCVCATVHVSTLSISLDAPTRFSRRE